MENSPLRHAGDQGPAACPKDVRDIRKPTATIKKIMAIFGCECRDGRVYLEGQDMEVIEDFVERVGDAVAGAILAPVWERPILKRDAQGIHGTLYYDWDEKKRHLPATKREVDWDRSSINHAQRELFASKR